MFLHISFQTVPAFSTYSEQLEDKTQKFLYYPPQGFDTAFLKMTPDLEGAPQSPPLVKKFA